VRRAENSGSKAESRGGSSITPRALALAFMLGFVLSPIMFAGYGTPPPGYGVYWSSAVKILLVDYNTTISFVNDMAFDNMTVYRDRVTMTNVMASPAPVANITMSVAVGNATLMEIGDEYVRVLIDSGAGYAIFNISVPMWGTPTSVIDETHGGKFTRVGTVGDVFRTAKSWCVDPDTGWSVINVPTASPTVITVRWYEPTEPITEGTTTTVTTTPSPAPEVPAAPSVPEGVSRVFDVLINAFGTAVRVIVGGAARIVMFVRGVMAQRAVAVASIMALLLLAVLAIVVARRTLE